MPTVQRSTFGAHFGFGQRLTFGHFGLQGFGQRLTLGAHFGLQRGFGRHFLGLRHLGSHVGLQGFGHVVDST